MRLLMIFMCSLLSTAFTNPLPESPIRVIYVYDPLCGWCYGFSPVIEKLEKATKAEAAFEVISGGMITGSRVGPISNMRDYISQAYKRVEEGSGVLFGDAFVKGTLQGNAEFSSLPPSVALTVFKSHQPDRAIAFSSRLQKAIYHDGMEPGNYNAYAPLAAEFGLDGNAFVKQMRDQKFIAQTEAEFKRAAAYGVTGYPTVLLEKDGKVHVLARGYVSYETLEAAYRKAVAR